MDLLSLEKYKKEKAFKMYVVENKDSFYRIAYTYVKNQDDALDIVQESICKGLDKIKSLKDVDSIKPWFYKLLINTSIDYIRKNKKYIQGIEEIAINSFVEHEIDVDIDIQVALDSLPKDSKSIIILRYFEDMKISDIATVLGENENTIKTRLYKSLKLLKAKINITVEGEDYE
ncbi:RNA polymerase subunit sigma-70 [Romboutsia weinsteinii]|uniref:RNA polymerase subunit sigma-70 n=1 Tax=Romboutsia weinsteinii TaxID=2020949 RepID=A0A371J3L1_9FIRM|nr:sigma-70 family RNA polymerase sigma factor [Romboutsia weinsteinii]RDY27258.1 RNA polymerase subunit sigma-70 [Romboutsia weinsteinii]